MAISASVNNYLTEHHIPFNVVFHSHSASAIGSAISASVSPDRVAKAVILEDHESRHLMAIMPASKHIRMKKLNKLLSRDFNLVHESELKPMFADCKTGAIPALGEAYNIESIIDDSLLEQKEVYLEAGDHEELIHLKENQFRKMMESCTHSRFSFSYEDDVW